MKIMNKSIVIIACLFSSLATTKATEISYGTVKSVVAGNNPTEIAFGDIDNDNDEDMVLIDLTDDNIRIRKNNGSGLFATPTVINLNGTPGGLALADFDNDNDLDIAISIVGNDQVRVLFNNGSGTFTIPINIAVGDSPLSLIAADFNNDSNDDIMVINFLSNNISLLRGNGNGTFQAAVNTQTPSIISFAAGKLDTDNDLDLVYVDFNSLLTALVNDGSGNFSSQVLGAEVDVQKLAIEDVNGDGRHDIVAASINPTDSISVIIRQNVNNIAFNASLTFPMGNNPFHIKLADFDNDNDLDVVTSDTQSNTLTIRANNGSGNFAGTPLTLNVGSDAEFLAIADLDGDNDLEIAVNDRVADQTVIFFNDTPSISDITDKLTTVGLPIAPINFTISKPNTNLVLSVNSANTTLVPNNSMTLGGFGENRNLTIQPVTTNGVALITITVSNTITGFTATDNFNLAAINPIIINTNGNNPTNGVDNVDEPLTGYNIKLKKPKVDKVKKFKSSQGFAVKGHVITSNTVNNVFFAVVVPGDTNNTNINFIAADKVKILEKGKLFKKKGVKAIFRSKSNKAGVGIPVGTTSLDFIVKVTGTAGTNVGEVLFTNSLTTQVK